MRPDVGTQAQFKKKKDPATYRFDSSLSPALNWDAENGARELGEWLIARIAEAAALPAPHNFPTPKTFTTANGDVVVEVRSLADAVDRLKRLGRPFLDWAGKAERLSFDVPTLPLFVHERLSTKAIVDTLVGHRSDKQETMFDLFGDPQHSVTDQVLRAYEHQDKWVNRLVLGDSLVVMNSLLRYEGLGGQVQMIYIDPPYGVKFGSNFQPFVRKRDVSHNDDEDLTREPEMVKAYRDTWELGLHSYLTYMRDRLLLARDLLTPSGSVFVQISDENLHHVRELMDEVFGAENFCGLISFVKTSGQTSELIAATSDYLMWYARDRERVKFRQLFVDKVTGVEGAASYSYVELMDGTRRRMTSDEVANLAGLPPGTRLFRISDLTSQRQGRPAGPGTAMGFEIEFAGRVFRPTGQRGWTTTKEGIDRLAAADRLFAREGSLGYLRYLNDFPLFPLGSNWLDTSPGYNAERLYVVQTTAAVVARCVFMTTDPGDLVLDPTCGSGTTAYVAEQWGRRWITIDTSRVPLALARQRLLTATFSYYQLKDAARGPAGGFVYVRKQNRRGEEVGGIVPHVTLKSIANNEPPEQEVLVDRPEPDNKIVRVTGPFAVEATIPTPVDWDSDGVEDSGSEAAQSYGSFVDRMIEVLRRTPVLEVGGGKKVTFGNVRPPAKSLSLSAEGIVDDGGGRVGGPNGGPVGGPVGGPNGGPVGGPNGGPKTGPPYDRRATDGPGPRVAFVFGPENGAISEKLVHAALQEAHLKSYAHLYVIGFAIQPHARQLIESAADMGLVPATYVQATLDLMMGDLLKNMRSSQIFSVCGLPDIKVQKLNKSAMTAGAPKARPAGAERGDGAPASDGERGSGGTKSPGLYQVELMGLDTFDPATMNPDHRNGNDVPAWFLDTDYNGLCFHVAQAFFPRTGAWQDLKKALKGDYDETVWDHLAGTKSAAFEAGEHKQIAVKVIDDRGNELLVVKGLPG